MKKTTFSPVFRKFVISYLIVLLLPNIAGYFSYQASIDAAVASSVENSGLLLNQSKEILETRLNEIKSFTKQLAIEQDLIRLMSEKPLQDSYNVYDLWKMSKDISNYSRTNEYLQHFYIYLNNYNVVLTPNAVFFRPDHFYSINRYADMSFRQWEDDIVSGAHENEIFPLRPYIRSGIQAPVITVIQSLPLNSFNKPKATVVVTIDQSKVGQLLEGMSDQFGGWGFITDGSGNIMLSSGIEPSDIDNLANVPSGQAGDSHRFQNGMLLISTRSDATGWLYTAGIPEEAVKQKANQIQYQTWTFTVLALIAGVIVILLFSYRHTAPIALLLGMFKEQIGSEPSRSSNEYDFIAGNISKLMMNNKQLEEGLEKQLPLLRDTFVKRLLTGEFLSLQEIEAVSAQIGKQPTPGQGYAALVQVTGYDDMSSEEIVHELNLARFVLQAALLDTMPELLTSDWGSDKVAVLYPFEGEDADEDGEWLVKLLEKVSESVFGQYRITVAASIGEAYQTLRDVHRSFDEAQQALEYSVYAETGGVARYRDIVRENAMFYYPIDTEQRLLKTLKAGEVEESLRIMDQVLSLNFVERELSHEMRQQLIAEIKGTLLKLLDQQPFYNEEFAGMIKNRIALLQPANKSEVLRSGLEWIMTELCRGITKKKSDHYHETIQTVKLFIEREYADADLSLYRIVESVNRPEKFVTQLFKEQTGESLIDYLERVRIVKASELLMEDRLTIDEIAAGVGYNSSHSFRRAFKRVKGISPSAFRQSSNG